MNDELELPSSAYHLGRDALGRDHYHDPMSGTVWAARGDEIVYETDLGSRSIVDWVLFVQDDVDGGWEQRQRVEKTGGLDDMLEGVIEREREMRDEWRTA